MTLPPKKRKPGSLPVVANLFCMMSCTVIETLRNCRHRDVSHISMPSEVTASDRQAHLFLECNGPHTKNTELPLFSDVGSEYPKERLYIHYYNKPQTKRHKTGAGAMGYFIRLEYTADQCVPHTKGLCIMKSIRWYCILQQIIQKIKCSNVMTILNL